jgi:hypothetical protein
MSEWNDNNYVLQQIKKDAYNAYKNASIDLQNNKQIFLETIKYVYYQNKGQISDGYIVTNIGQKQGDQIIIPEKFKYDEEVCQLYSYYMYSILTYNPNDSNYNIIQTIQNNIKELDNYNILLYPLNNGNRFIYILKSLIFSQRKVKDELKYELNDLRYDLNNFKYDLNEFKNNFYKLKYDNDNINYNLYKLKYDNNKLKDEFNKLKYHNNKLKLYLTKFKYDMNNFKDNLKDDLNYNKLKFNIIIIIIIIIIILYYIIV